jgi:hypothetical protein
MISFRGNYTMHLLLRLLIAISSGSWLPVTAYCQYSQPAVAMDDLIDSNAEARAFAPGVVSSYDELEKRMTAGVIPVIIF